MAFLEDVGLRPLSFSKDVAFEPIGLAIGEGGGYALEIAVVRSKDRPGATEMRTAWTARLNGRPVPLLLVALYSDDSKAAVCGPEGQQPPVYHDLDVDQVERICLTALQEPDRHRAFIMLQDTLPEVGSRIPGLHNEGLLATHELENGVPLREDWREAVTQSKRLLSQRGQPLLRSLGFEIQNLTGPVSVLIAQDTKVAVGLFLDRSESIDLPSERFSNLSPIAYALARADKERLPYVVVMADGVLRLYPVQAGVGVGQRGRTETYVQLHLDLLSEDKAGYIWLLFSAGALLPKGTFEEILSDSANYSADLGSRLRERIYSDVIPQLAQSIAQARKMEEPTKDELDETYQMALTLLFRLLFVAYAEDKGLLPYKTNESYHTRSINQRTQELLRMERDGIVFDQRDTMWREIQNLFDSIDKGQRAWGIPPYNGGLFASDPETAPTGAALREITLTDQQFGPALRDLLIEDSVDGVRGSVDFRSLSVREFGTIYEGLLQSELSVAQTDLGLDKDGLYVPVEDEKRIVVQQGEIYLHNASGARKSTGSYYTKSFAVEHLLDHALEPALDDHLARLDELDERAAGEAFFDFRIADIAMGSGHFLVAAVDRIERRFATYIAGRPLPDVTDELTRLRERAKEVIEAYGGRFEVEDTLLLRRQIARRCIYGVDVNPMAVDLARLSIWIHTFVPGLPLSLLDYNLVQGNSLVGVATLDEAKSIMQGEKAALFGFSANELLGPAKEHLAKLGRLADADSAEIARARDAHQEARKALRGTAALLDILAASRVNEKISNMIEMGESIGWVKNLETLPDSELHKEAVLTLEDYPMFHYPIAFPQVFLREQSGFDVLLGNPPWEEVKAEEHWFWPRYFPGIRSLSQREREAQVKYIKSVRPDLVKRFQREKSETDFLNKILTAGGFPGMETGDTDVYKAFIWRFWRLCRDPKGFVGVVLPRAALMTKGSEEYRRQMFAEADVTDMTIFVNRNQWFFDDVHPQFTIGLVSYERGKGAELSLRGPYTSLEKYQIGMKKPAVVFDTEDVLSWTDSASLPMLPSDDSGEVFAQLRQHPPLGLDVSDSWRARPYRELDATNDKKLMEFTENPSDHYWPIFKGESFYIWEPDKGVYYAWADPDTMMKHLQKKRVRGGNHSRSAFYEFKNSEIADSKTLPCLSPRIAFQNNGRASDRRTIKPALVPPKVFITNAAPHFLWPRGDKLDEAFLLGVLSIYPRNQFGLEKVGVTR